MCRTERKKDGGQEEGKLEVLPDNDKTNDNNNCNNHKNNDNTNDNNDENNNKGSQRCYKAATLQLSPTRDRDC